MVSNCHFITSVNRLVAFLGKHGVIATFAGMNAVPAIGVLFSMGLPALLKTFDIPADQDSRVPVLLVSAAVVAALAFAGYSFLVRSY